MATAPFTLNITIPGDTDVVSQFPGVDRTHLGIINSWINTEHNLNGTHSLATFLQVGVADSGGVTVVAPAPTANNTSLYRDTDGALKAKRGDDSSVEFMGGVPPGVFLPYGGSTLPTGWLWCDGTTVSRSTYARLFTAIGTNYGAGDGSTTFGLPDLNGRSVLGRDRTSTGRVTTAGSGVDGTTLGASGGFQNTTLTQSDLPNVTIPIVITDTGHFHSIHTTTFQAGGNATGLNGNPGSAVTSTEFTGITAVTASINGGVAQTVAVVMNPVLVANYIIRT